MAGTAMASAARLSNMLRMSPSPSAHPANLQRHIIAYVAVLQDGTIGDSGPSCVANRKAGVTERQAPPERRFHTAENNILARWIASVGRISTPACPRAATL